MIDTWKEIVLGAPEAFVGWGGLIIGIVFGFTIQRSNFCSMGAISDFLTFGDWRRFRSWLLAGAVAILGVLIIERAGAVDLTYSLYTGTTFQWGGHIIGGLMFGFGMVFGGGCVSKNLARAGGGDLRSLIVLIIIGISGYMTIGGLFAQARVFVTEPLTADLSGSLDAQTVDAVLAGVTGMAAGSAKMVAALVIAGAIIVYAFMDKGFRSSLPHVSAGVVIGLCVVAGWFLTGLAFDDFADNPMVESLSYVRPAGDTVDYLMRFTAYAAPSFTVVTLIGALIGAFASAITSKKFNWATFTDPADTMRNLFGAVLMGIGGVTAIGCTIGQSVTGFSTLAMGSILTFLCIILGGIVGVKVMERLA